MTDQGVLDTLGMFEVTAGLPEQAAGAVGAAHGLDGLPEREYVENVVVLGMGGSGLAGDVMVAVAGPFVPVPITVVKSYDLPDFVGRGSLVFAISFSGNTEETVEAAGEAVDQLKSRRDRLVQPGSTAEEVARRIGRTIPLIHGAQAVGAAAALRWKAQVNENAKAPAFAAVYPELCHNEIAGWGQHGDVTRQVITLINLRHDAEHPQLARRFAFVSDVLREVVADIIEVRAQGEGDLAQLLDLMLVGDFVSLQLAAREGIDPGPVPVLEELKQCLLEP